MQHLLPRRFAVRLNTLNSCVGAVSKGLRQILDQTVEGIVAMGVCVVSCLTRLLEQSIEAAFGIDLVAQRQQVDESPTRPSKAGLSRPAIGVPMIKSVWPL